MGLAVKFTCPEDKQEFIESLPEGTWALVLPTVMGGPTTIRYHADYIKWYSTRLLMGADTGYAEVNAYETILSAAQEANELDRDDPAFIPSSGAFARLGEQDDDVESWAWNADCDDCDDMPSGWDLVQIERSVSVFVSEGGED